MKKDSWLQIQQIELINEYITDECQEYLYYVPKSNSRIFEKIRNAALTILNNSMRLLRNQSPIINCYKEPLTIEQSKELMFKIYQILSTTDFPIKKVDKIKAMMKNEFFLNPDELLKEMPSDEEEYKRVCRILHNGF